MATLTLRQSALSLLLARYMHGQINDALWGGLMRLFDADGVTSTERLAFARFVSDVADEEGLAALYVPREEEVTALLSATRL